MAALAVRVPREIRHLAQFGASIDAVFPSEPVWYLQALAFTPTPNVKDSAVNSCSPPSPKPTALASPATWRRRSRTTATTTSESGSANSAWPHPCTPADRPCSE